MVSIEFFVLRIATALAAGLFIGFEREIQDKNAGLKTNALVSLGAAVFVLASLHFRGEEFVDITRVLGQVVTGIGFIGAGVILHKGTKIEGLTTAATVWCSAGAGALAGVGLFKEVIAVVFAILFVNVLLARVNIWIDKKWNNKKSQEE